MILFDSSFVGLIADYLLEQTKASTLYGFRGGPAGLMHCKYVQLTTDFIYPYRNQVRNFT